MRLLNLKTYCAIRLLRCAVLASAPIRQICLGRCAPRALHSNRSLRFLAIPLNIILALTFLLPGISIAQPTILVFGDSLSAGYGIAREASWPNLLQQELRRDHPQYAVVNASISGETTSGGLRRIGPALQQHRPAIVIIELGANDGLRGAAIAETERNLSALITQARKANAKVLLLGIQIPPNYGLDYAKQFRKLYAKLAKRHRVALVPFMLEGIAPEQFQADNLHPNAEAQARIMRTVLEELKTLL
ncbi:MAG: arylesterase [Nitrosomonadales bacterium]|nr:arylesterase [Nitrosomonadales bacterium]